jgi:hypothetical protein
MPYLASAIDCRPCALRSRWTTRQSVLHFEKLAIGDMADAMRLRYEVATARFSALLRANRS